MYKNLIVTISTRMANYFSLFEVALLASFIPGIRKGTVALANIFCWAAALLYAQMGAKSVVISPHPL